MKHAAHLATAFCGIGLIGCGEVLTSDDVVGSTAEPLAVASFINGSFELGVVDPGAGLITALGVGSTSITGWTVTSGDIDYIGGYWQASDGTRSLDLSGYRAGSISQTFDTTVGQSYEAVFDLAGEPLSHPPPIKTVRVSAAGTSSDYFFDTTTGTTGASMGWQEHTFKFTATASTTTLTFASLDNSDAGPALDNVRVSVNCDPTARITVNGHQLRRTEEIWLRYFATDVVPQLPGDRATRVRSAATVAWWALKEGVLSLRNPNNFSLCSMPVGNGRFADVTLRAIQLCPAGRPWQVGLAAAQVPNFTDADVMSAARAVRPGSTIAEVLAEAAAIAGHQPNVGPAYSAIVASRGRLQKSWLLRHPLIGTALQYPIVQAECVRNTLAWCYGSWPTALRYAPDSIGSLKSIDDLTSALSCIAP